MAGMMTGLLLLLLVGVTVGRVVDLHKRIYGGQECDKTERLYHVKLITYDGTKNSLCGGSLINKDWILTAGHCVPEGRTTRVIAFLRVNQDGEKNPVDINIKEIERKKDSKGTHDIALLKLDATGYEIVSLPDCENRLTNGKTVQVAGHGPITANPNDITRSTTLQCANTKVTKCKVDSCQVFHSDPVQRFCYTETGVGTREGDSGGGVMYHGMIYGVHVSGLMMACGKVDEGEAKDVCEYQDWIEIVTKSSFPKVKVGIV